MNQAFGAPVRSREHRRASGLFNLNFYARNLAADYRDFRRYGAKFWSAPAHNDFGPAVGETMEVVFEGPDSIPINLVQLATRDPKTMIGGMRRFVDEYGRTPQGYTPVVTTAHGVVDMDQAVAFYEAVLDMEVAMESVVDAPETNRVLSLPDDARTRSVLVQGDHPFGKITLSQPINYEIESLVPRATAPNVGYLAQFFEVSELDAAYRACASLNVSIFSAPAEIDLPGRGRCASMLVRNPGSGALQEIFEAQ